MPSMYALGQQRHVPYFFSITQRGSVLEDTMISLIDTTFHVNEQNWDNHLQSNKKMIERIQLGVFSEMLLKTANYVVSIFKTGGTSLSRLLVLNDLAKSLKEKHIELLHFSKKENISLVFLKYQDNPQVSIALKKSIGQLQQFQYRLYQKQFNNLCQSLKQRKLTSNQQENLFNALPKVVQHQIFNHTQGLGITQQEISGSLKKIAKKTDVFQWINTFYEKQIEDCEHKINEPSSAYEKVKQRSELKKIGQYTVSIIEPYSKLKQYYLECYSEFKVTGKSSKNLPHIFLEIPEAYRIGLPSPYGINIDCKKHENYGAFYSKTRTVFSVYAPKARSVSVVLYNEREEVEKECVLHRNLEGQWQLKVANLKPGQRYQYKIEGNLKIDPYSRRIIPSKDYKKPSYSILVDSKHKWSDAAWVESRKSKTYDSTGMSIYELHPTAWMKRDGKSMNYRELAKEIVDHVKKTGFTHVELMGILEHPDERSWGYQVTGYFAPNSRLGSVDDFKYMINYLHENNIGVILDWIPGHFATDDYGLQRFDGSSLFEPSSYNLAYLISFRNLFQKFGSKHFDYTKKNTREFLLSSMVFWLRDMHIDGIRVDCVRGIIQSESPKNAEIFLRDLNAVVHQDFPGVMTIAEDYSGDTRVLNACELDGFGFDFQFGVAWKHFLIKFFNTNPSLRTDASHYELIQAGMNQDKLHKQIPYISHDETQSCYQNFQIQGGDIKEKKANFKSMISFLMTAGKNRMMFSGLEIANQHFWNQFIGTNCGIMDKNHELDTYQKEILNITTKLNRLYQEEKALYRDKSQTIDWIQDPSKIIHAYRSSAEDSSISIFHNFTNKEMKEFKVTIPKKEGKNPCEIFTSDEIGFSGKHLVDIQINTDSICYTLHIPPLTTVLIRES